MKIVAIRNFIVLAFNISHGSVKLCSLLLQLRQKNEEAVCVRIEVGDLLWRKTMTEENRIKN